MPTNSPRKEGQVWRGQSGRWFTIKDGRTVPTKAPGQRQQANQRPRAVKRPAHKSSGGKHQGTVARAKEAVAAFALRLRDAITSHLSGSKLPAKLAAGSPSKSQKSSRNQSSRGQSSAKPQQKSTVTLKPGLHPVARQHLLTVAGSLKKAGHLKPEQKKAYFEACQTVMANMTPRMLQRFSKHVTREPYFGKDTEDVRQELLRRNAHNRQVVEQLKVARDVGGCYMHGKSGNGFVLDGDGKGAGVGPLANRETASIYAHEFGHAIDGPNYEISGSPEWKSAFEQEIKKGQLTKYATSKPSEGLAEFSRLMLSGKYSRSMVQRKFPKCYAVWQKHGLVESEGQAGSRRSLVESDAEPLVLDEMFSSRIELGGEAHADVLLPSSESDRHNQP